MIDLIYRGTMSSFKKNKKNTYAVRDAKTHFSKLLRLIESGEEVIITKGHEPVAKLVPLQQSKKREFGFAKGQIWMSDDFDDAISYGQMFGE